MALFGLKQHQMVKRVLETKLDDDESLRIAYLGVSIVVKHTCICGEFVAVRLIFLVFMVCSSGCIPDVLCCSEEN